MYREYRYTHIGPEYLRVSIRHISEFTSILHDRFFLHLLEVNSFIKVR